MPFNTDFLVLLNQRIGWQAYQGLDIDGNPSWYPIITYFFGFVEITISKMSSSGFDQSETVGPSNYASGVAYCEPLAFNPRDKLTLTSGIITYVNTVQIYVDPLVGDPGLAELHLTELP